MCSSDLLQSPLRRNPSGAPLQFDSPNGNGAKLARPQLQQPPHPRPQPNPQPEPRRRDPEFDDESPSSIVSHLSEVLDSLSAARGEDPSAAASTLRYQSPRPTNYRPNAPAVGAVPHSNGNGRSAPAPAAPVLSAAPAELPDSLKPFAPGSPDSHREVAAIVGSPRWRPGDDDVIPGDGRKGLRRPRFRDRLGL